jgi:hypothetical protein
VSEDEHFLSIDSAGDGEDKYFVDGKRVDQETWRKYLRDSKDKLGRMLDKDIEDYLERDLEASGNELVTNLSTSGISAFIESGKADSVAVFTQWAKKELPNVITQSHYDAASTRRLPSIVQQGVQKPLWQRLHTRISMTK